MSDNSTKFGTMLNCMDGRIQNPVTLWMKEQFALDVVDAPNPAGPTNMIVKGDEIIVENYRTKTLISINGHGSRHVAIVAHQGCAKNPISDEEQLTELQEAVRKVATEWYLPADIEIVGLWLTKVTDLDWEVHHIATEKTAV